MFPKIKKFLFISIPNLKLSIPLFLYNSANFTLFNSLKSPILLTK